jgi:hypothetical protein
VVEVENEDKATQIAVSKHIVEIRFKPDGNMIDRKGYIANFLVDGNNLFDRWSIEDRVNLRADDNPNIKAFISHKNVGVTSHHPNNSDLFIAEASKFIHSAWSLFGDRPLLRLGVRSTLVVPVGDFAATVERYKDKFLKLDNSDLQQLGGEIIDVGFPIHFVSGDDCFNIMTGPMKSEQIQMFMKEVDSKYYPSVGIFLDLDYSRTKFSGRMKQQAVCDYISSGVAKAYDILNTIQNWVSGADDGAKTE